MLFSSYKSFLTKTASILDWLHCASKTSCGIPKISALLGLNLPSMYFLPVGIHWMLIFCTTPWTRNTSYKVNKSNIVFASLCTHVHFVPYVKSLYCSAFYCNLRCCNCFRHAVTMMYCWRWDMFSLQFWNSSKLNNHIFICNVILLHWAFNIA